MIYPCFRLQVPLLRPADLPLIMNQVAADLWNRASGISVYHRIGGKLLGFFPLYLWNDRTCLFPVSEKCDVIGPIFHWDSGARGIDGAS